MLEFENRKYITYFKISDILQLLPAIFFYIEKKRIKDGNAFFMGVHWLVFQAGIFIRLKKS